MTSLRATDVSFFYGTPRNYTASAVSYIVAQDGTSHGIESYNQSHGTSHGIDSYNQNHERSSTVHVNLYQNTCIACSIDIEVCTASNLCDRHAIKWASLCGKRKHALQSNPSHTSSARRQP